MSSYERALELVTELEAAGIRATADPRSATPPCVLVTPPRRVYDLACGYTATWRLVALAPGTNNADAHKLLSALVDDVRGVIRIRGADSTAYSLSADAPSLPAYVMEYEEAVS